MTAPPTVDIDPDAFWDDPYPTLARLRADAPIAFVPQLGAILISTRDQIATCEKRIDVFSSDQPDGLMTQLMGQNMMRKDGDVHLAERKATFPTLSPRTVRDVWTARFRTDTEAVLSSLRTKGRADLVREFAMPVAGNALRAITGLETVTAAEMDHVSQAMIDGISNYAGDPKVETRCHEATRQIDNAIDTNLSRIDRASDASLLGAQLRASLSIEAIRANVKLAISGGQNEPRDAIAGAVWALLSHPDQMGRVTSGEIAWQQVFDEYVRWVSPIGMSPRRVAKDHTVGDVTLAAGQRAFFMFGSANRDEAYFVNGDQFDLTRDASKHIAFGAGPHFCAGAAASRSLIANIALPMIFDALPNMRLTNAPRMVGWAFRGLQSLHVEWD